jgi:hypothetical protein
MANTIFASVDQFLEHVVSPLPLTRSRSEELFRWFGDSGHLSRQEEIGITVLPKFALGTDTGVLRLMTEGAADATNGIQLVLLSPPSMPEEEFDSWVEVVRGWALALPVATRAAISRKIRETKRVEDGVPLSILSAGMPESLLLSYRRNCEWVMVFDSPVKNKRKIWATKNIG